MKDVGGGRVVDDDDFVELSAEATEVLDVVAAVEDARLAEEARVEHVPLVQQVRHGVGVLRAGGSFNCHTSYLSEYPVYQTTMLINSISFGEMKSRLPWPGWP